MNDNQDQLKTCDCCDARVSRLYFSITCGIETYACARCHGLEEEEEEENNDA